MLDSTVTLQVQEVLDSLNAALEEGDVQAASALFATDSYWRDLVAVTWNLKTVEGPSGVQDMLTAQLKHTKPHAFAIQESEAPGEDGGVVTAWI
ncbi:MAG: nuclear transport factor 2 family protein, partial [Nitratireductor sp.]